MLACVQHQHHPVHHLPCVTQIPDTTLRQQSELSAVRSPRYPSVAQLDAYAQKTADSPLSIQIFPSNVRVPQHKQINRTINGLDPGGQPFSTGHQGLLAMVKSPTADKGLLKRCKLSPVQMAVAPYVPPSHRHGQKPCDVGPDVPAASSVSDRPVRSVIQHMSRPSNCSPAFPADSAASCSDSAFTVGGSARSGRVYAGAVLPTQKASGYVDGLDFWQQVYSPEVCVPVRLPYRHHQLHSTRADFSAGQLLVSQWNGVLATADSESYNQQEPPHLRPHTRGRLQPYPTERSTSVSGKSLCQASLLSSSLKSLECLISDIHPACIKEQMLGRGDTHLHLPVFT
ncbi:protein FAM222A [Triplophysa rosa]|uniref:Protein FAM222A n=1 Tax=Triplophysa rosa TaxID=992332 RepID=A0A9W7WA50_TRIRA|nr:protein FAM222A [Triplophysa rosa]XP_057177131.1 protein FAM222A [Triplophysa rosa]XP_057177132.1 protein FAM222A [Triplophysa rosa]KAI7793247.1 putative protein FAM222A-like [Triplophysa rosa]